jgi:hypothetical protein
MTSDMGERIRPMRRSHRMTGKIRKLFARIATCACLVFATGLAKAQTADPDSSRFQIGLTSSAVLGIGVGLYDAVHHSDSLTGCAVVTPDGLRMQSEGDQQTYSLVGQLTGINSGDRVRVSGMKVKPEPDSPLVFIVEKVVKDFGSCKIAVTAN